MISAGSINKSEKINKQRTEATRKNESESAKFFERTPLLIGWSLH